MTVCRSYPVFTGSFSCVSSPVIPTLLSQDGPKLSVLACRLGMNCRYSSRRQGYCIAVVFVPGCQTVTAFL